MYAHFICLLHMVLKKIKILGENVMATQQPKKLQTFEFFMFFQFYNPF